MLSNLDFITPNNRLKIAGRSITRTKPLPNNWVDFARLCDIRSGDGVIKFDPYDFQLQVIRSIEQSKTTICAKGRQLGLTESVSNYFLWKACTKRGYLAVIFSRTQSDTSNIAKRLRRMVESLAEYVTPVTDSLTDLELSSGGRILFRNSTAFGSRGLESVSDILFDEASFIEDIEEIFKSAIPTTSMLGEKARIVVLSTPNGQAGWYFDKLNSNNGAIDLLQLCEDVRTSIANPVQIWHDSKGWNKILIHWKAHPIYGAQDDYLERVVESTGLPEADVRQEYDLSFTDSEEGVFSPILVRAATLLETLEKSVVGTCSYFVGIDSASGGEDYTVGVVIEWNREKQEYSMVDLYRKRKQSTEFDIFQLVELITKYKPLGVGIETNSIGAIYLEQLKQALPSAKLVGINTTQDSKIMGAGKINMLLEMGKLLLPKNSPVIEEMLSFKRKGKRLEAMSGKHDDIVMALSFALEVSPFLFKKTAFKGTVARS
ncbi:terminase large subunit domain-containing protein [Chamaesiphon sp. OTE_8_metabat_110]|uniref:phage terminase large subunit family protein n=1 Tax=Chamaesiphon sp. OTE_8_metabat_110 TaxID=2964696 RepID=UPI00286A9C1B|nr:terminase family protein [Chamaesiphon sp. OTE_8_metabat_110]